MYFEYRSMYCCEAFSSPIDALHIPCKSRFRISNRDGLFLSNGLEGESIDVWDRIAEYTARGLTYQSDIVNGMLGPLHAFHRLDQPVYHL